MEEDVILRPSIRLVQLETARAFGVPFEAMIEGGAKLSRPRHAAMFLSRRLTNKSSVVIGRAFNRDHSTVLYGIERARATFRHDPTFRLLIDAARRAIAKAIPPT